MTTLYSIQEKYQQLLNLAEQLDPEALKDSALRLPVRLYVSLLFVFFFVQFSKVNFFCCESVLSASATFINIPRFLPFVNTFYKVFMINMELFSLLGFYMLFLKCLKS